MHEKTEEKLHHCVLFILERFQQHQQKWIGKERPPFFLGLNGVQGAGKTVLVSSLAQTLSEPPHCLPTTVFSIDDLYLPHEKLSQLALDHPNNPLIQHRGQPSTHDLPLLISLFSSLHDGGKTAIPTFDKSAFSGKGDRTSQSEWKIVNEKGEKKIEMVIFEGWCVGFRALKAECLQRSWHEAMINRAGGGYIGRLGWNRFEDIDFVNNALKGYDAITNQLDAMVYMDAEDTQYVYEWRLEQEQALRQQKGSGMTDEEVVAFVNGYYPAYELYSKSLRQGVFPGEKGKQMRLVIGRDRNVKQIDIT